MGVFGIWLNYKLLFIILLLIVQSPEPITAFNASQYFSTKSVLQYETENQFIPYRPRFTFSNMTENGTIITNLGPDPQVDVGKLTLSYSGKKNDYITFDVDLENYNQFLTFKHGEQITVNTRTGMTSSEFGGVFVPPSQFDKPELPESPLVDNIFRIAYNIDNYQVNSSFVQWSSIELSLNYNSDNMRIPAHEISTDVNLDLPNGSIVYISDRIIFAQTSGVILERHYSSVLSNQTHQLNRVESTQFLVSSQSVRMLTYLEITQNVQPLNYAITALALYFLVAMLRRRDFLTSVDKEKNN